MWQDLDIWLLLAGLGIFLFGIKLIEGSIATLGGRDLKRMLRTYTSRRFRAIITGTVATLLLQSSTAVTLMVMAFVGAGIISLPNSIGVVLGANIGTTATSWIVATVGFKLDIAEFALPFIGIGGLVSLFLGKSPRYSQVSHLLVGFGFLFLGLDQMKDSVSAFAETFDASRFAGSAWWVFVGVGLVLTAIMQSSTVTVAIMLTALHGGLFEFREAALAVVGCSVGTTSTAFLGSLNAATATRRVAMTNVVFNVFAAAVAVATLPLYMRLFEQAWGPGYDQVLAVALFFTAFNVVGVLLFVPLIGPFGRLVERLTPERDTLRAHVIANIAPDVPEAAVPGVREEVRYLLLGVIDLHRMLFGVKQPVRSWLPWKEEAGVAERYDDLKLLQAEIITYGTKVEQHGLGSTGSDALNRAMHAARLALYAAKTLKDVKANIDAFEGDDTFAGKYLMRSRERIAHTHKRMEALLQMGDTNGGYAAEVAALERWMQEDDTAGLKELSQGARDGLLKERDLGTAMQVHRAISQSSHDLLKAVAEMQGTMALGEGIHRSL
ncbi:MAG: Na/Pi cotransporter family protein [Flavobacteriales bacterium]|nr:Na/Pi cotransporter family protein [Flavobacteriales bacterium]